MDLHFNSKIVLNSSFLHQILAKIECLELYSIKTSGKVTLFSSVVIPEIGKFLSVICD